MELYQLRSFVAIAQEGNLTRSAERLHLSQSALSSQIKALEESLGVELFKRSSRGMKLSEHGLSLLRHAEEVLETAARLGQEADLLKRRSGTSMTIGLNADPTFLRVSAINQRLSYLHTGMNTIFLTSQSVDTARMLKKGMIDLGLFYGEIQEPDIETSVLSHVRFCLVVPTALHQQSDPKNWDEIACLPWIWVGNDCPPYRFPQNKFDQIKKTPNQAVFAVDEQIVRELVIAGQGVAIMREDEASRLAESGKVIVWEQGWHSLPLCLGWLSGRSDEKMIASARETIHHIWNEPATGVRGQLSDKYWA